MRKNEGGEEPSRDKGIVHILQQKIGVVGESRGSGTRVEVENALRFYVKKE